MNRKLMWMAALALVSPGCGQGVSPQFAFGVLGDAPYAPGEAARVSAVLEDMNRADLAFVVHVGDVQAQQPREPVPGGTPTCTDASLRERLELFAASRHPFIVTPGDNDWTDCHEAGSPMDPLERLASFRRHFYPTAESLGERRLTLASQGADPGAAAYVENRLWTHGEVVFLTVHMVGSDNNAGRTPEMDAEAAARDAAGRAWMAHAFERAAREKARAVAIFTQANPQFETTWPRSQVRRYLYGLPAATIPEPRRPTGFDGFVEDLKRHVAGFSGPVLLVHGDTHLFRVDKPLVSPADGRVVQNFTRMETFGSPDVHWVRVLVDPGRRGLFAFSPEMVP